MAADQDTMTFPTLPGSPEGPSDHHHQVTSIKSPKSLAEIIHPVAVILAQRNSIASDFSCSTHESFSSSQASTEASSSSPSTAMSRPISGTALATSSRPSSVASNTSSSSSYNQIQGQLAACPGLLSPGLASALGLGPPIASASTSSLSEKSKAHRRVRATSTHGSGLANRRPSMPIVPSMNHRMSVASVSSFESLPEDEIVQGFNILVKSRSGSYERIHNSSRIIPPIDTSSAASSKSCTAFPVVQSVSSSPSKSFAALPASTSSTCHHETDPSSSSYTSTISAISSRLGVQLKRSATDPARTTEFSALMARRKRHAIELLETEKTFMASLTLLDQEYYQPLMASLGRGKSGATSPTVSSTTQPILPRKSMVEIFSNFSDILYLSKELLSRLEARLLGASKASNPDDFTDIASSPWDPAKDTIGDILVPLAPFLKMYSLYVKNFSSALQRIEAERKTNDTFSKFLKDTETQRWTRERAAVGKQSFGFGLGFQAHLLTIVQRIPRYKLLVDDLIKTTPDTHPDWPDLTKAGEMIEQVASYINENVRQHEMVLMMLSLQRSIVGLIEPLVVPGRSLVKRGTLMKTCRRNIQPREFFLFTDCLIYASPISGGIESASAAWLALAQRGRLYGGPTYPDSLSGSRPTSPTAGAELATAIETVILPTRLRTVSGPEPYTPLAGAIFSLAGHQLQYRSKFALRDCTVVSVDVNTSDGLCHCFEIRTPEKSFAVYAENAASKDVWVTAIREARADFMSARRTLKAEEDSIEAKRDRRRSQYKGDTAKITCRRLSMQSLHRFASSTSLTSQKNAISEVDGEGVDRVQPRPRTDSLPNSVRPPSFPSFPSSATNLSLATLLAPSTNATPTRPLRVLEDYNAPVWVPDSRADKCSCCSEPFGMWRRKHHCRLCGQVVCWSCSQRYFLIPSYQDEEEDKPARACDSCYDSTFPSESPESPLATLEATSLSPTSTDMASVPSTDDCLNGLSSNSRLGSENSPDSPFTPSEDASPHLVQAGCVEHASLSTVASGVHHDDHRTEVAANRSKSLRFDDLTISIPSSGSHPMLASRSKSLSSGGLLHIPERSTALDAQLFNATLSPPVHAATSGSGTFRLVTPRMTTPEAEEPPGFHPIRRCSQLPPITAQSYFTQVVDGTAATSQKDQSSPDLANGPQPIRPSMIHAASGIPAHLRPQKKRPMSAAARLSTFYGAGLGFTSDEKKK